MLLGTELLFGNQSRARWTRLDTTDLLRRFYFCERSLLISQAAWIPLIAQLDIKTGLAQFVWQGAETADALRRRVLELRAPIRIQPDKEADRCLVEVFDTVRNAPSVLAFLLSIQEVLLPALMDFYRAYGAGADSIADGPTLRFMSLALAEKNQQVAMLKEWSHDLLSLHSESRDGALSWTNALSGSLKKIALIRGDQPCSEVMTHCFEMSKAYAIPSRPARDARFWSCRFYWPDVVDPDYPYGEGMLLQLRSAVGHLNEVWAIETGGIILSAFANVLPWEWIRDSARWTYDEARHCRMGYERFLAWGFEPGEIPLGTYLYESASGCDPLYRLAMLYFLERKNVRNKRIRLQRFRQYGDALSEHDLDFDWADETIHVGYGRRWLKALIASRGGDPAMHDDLQERCYDLLKGYIATASPEEIADIKNVAEALIAKAERVVARCSLDSRNMATRETTGERIEGSSAR